MNPCHEKRIPMAPANSDHAENKGYTFLKPHITIPISPDRDARSCNSTHEVIISRSGVNDKNGSVLYMGEICNARIYKTSAIASNGGESTMNR
jgi:hypothetical protein